MAHDLRVVCMRSRTGEWTKPKNSANRKRTCARELKRDRRVLRDDPAPHGAAIPGGEGGVARGQYGVDSETSGQRVSIDGLEYELYDSRFFNVSH